MIPASDCVLDSFGIRPAPWPRDLVDAVRAYRLDHPDASAEDCARELGVSVLAVALACERLMDRGY